MRSSSSAHAHSPLTYADVQSVNTPCVAHSFIHSIIWLQVWKIKRFSGACEHNLRAEVSMVSTTKERKPWPRPPISMSFQVRLYSALVLSNVHGVNCPYT
jgi:hypothetical protein